MTSAAHELLEQAKRLPQDERQALAEAIWDMLEGRAGVPVGEIGGRVTQLERGEVKAIPWSETEAQLRRKHSAC